MHNGLEPDDRQALYRLGDRTLAWPQGCWYWGDAIAYDGLLAADGILEVGWADQLAERVDRWAGSAPDSWDDALAPGRAIARLVLAGKASKDALNRVVRAIARCPRTESGVPLLRPHVPEWRSLVWVDSLYHLPAGLAAAGQALDREDLVEEAARVAIATLDLLACRGSVAQAYDAGRRENNQVCWTRGIGWAMLGLLDLIELLGPVNSHAEQLGSRTRGLMRGLVGVQLSDGHWPTTLERPSADSETSVAAFYLAAARHPSAVAFDLPREAAESAARAVKDAVDHEGLYQGVSKDTHVRWEVDGYLRPPVAPSPWGQGAALRAIASLC